MKVKVYNKKGQCVNDLELLDLIWAQKFKNDLVHQVYVSITSNLRSNIASTKDRSEVRGGGRKPWRQKGTGNARVGSRRSPLWRGGGITFGPNSERVYKKSINKKMKKAALFSALAEKNRLGLISFFDDLSVNEFKTSKLKNTLNDISKVNNLKDLLMKKKNSAIFLFDKLNLETKKSFSNFSNIEIKTINNLNLIDVLKYKNLVFADSENCLKYLEKK